MLFEMFCSMKNVFINAKNERVVNYSEIVIYNFETEIFSKKFEKAFTENKINGHSHGLVDFLQDGSKTLVPFRVFLEPPLVFQLPKTCSESLAWSLNICL